MASEIVDNTGGENRKVKDSVFVDLFGKDITAKENFLSLAYSASSPNASIYTFSLGSVPDGRIRNLLLSENLYSLIFVGGKPLYPSE